MKNRMRPIASPGVKRLLEKKNTASFRTEYDQHPLEVSGPYLTDF